MSTCDPVSERSLRKILLSRLPPLVCLASLAAMLVLGYAHQFYVTTIMDQQQAQLRQITRKAASDLDHIARDVMFSADAIARDLSQHAPDEALQRQAESQLRQRVTENTNFYGAAITYKPYAFRKNQRLYSAYYLKRDGKVTFEALDQVYDYSNGQPQHAWYSGAMANGSRWSPRYYDAAARTLMITYSAVFTRPDPATGQATPLGVVTIDVSLDVLKHIMESLPLGVGGYGSLVTSDGTYLYHPTGDYAATGKTLLNIATRNKDANRRFLYDMLQTQHVSGGILDHISVTTGLPSWLAYEPVPATRWLLINTFLKDDVPLDNDHLRRQWLLMTSCAVLFLISLATLGLGQAGGARLWALIAISTLVLMMGIGTLLHFALRYDSQLIKGAPVVHHADIDQLSRKLDAAARQRGAEAPVYLPTGILIESLRFADGNDVIFSGQAWQRLDATMPAGLVPGFNLLASEDVKMTEIYRHSAHGRTVVRWQFQGRVRQHLRHARYPFERDGLSFTLAARDLAHRIILVPDLDAYVLNNPAALPGLAGGLQLPGWEIQKSFFDLSRQLDSLSLGMEARTGQGESLPLLRYNVVVQKNFLDSFVSNQFPLIVVSLMLFALLVTTTTEETLMDKMKTTAGMALSMSSALIFIVVFSHIGLRRIVISDDIFYLEYFYFVMYIAILSVAITSIFHALHGKRYLRHYQDILIVRLLYWPSIFGLLFLGTLGVFY